MVGHGVRMEIMAGSPPPQHSVGDGSHAPGATLDVLQAPALDVAAIRLWRRGAVPRWATDVLAGAWAMAFVTTGIATASLECTTQAPCGPNELFARCAVLLFATPILLVWLPLLGCFTGAAFGLLEVLLDNSAVPMTTFAIHGAACLIVGNLIVLQRRRQQRAALVLARGVQVAIPPVRDRRGLPGPGPRIGVALLLTVAGISAFGWYLHLNAVERAHVAAAQHRDAYVDAVDAGDVNLSIPGVGDWTVYTSGSYAVGDRVQVLFDPDGNDGEGWIELVAESADNTPLETLGLTALAFGGLLAHRDVSAVQARRRRFGGSATPLPTFKVLVRPGLLGRAELYPVDVAPHGKRFGSLRVVAEPLTEPLMLPPAGPAGLPGVLLGDVRRGGWVAVLLGDALLAPETPLTVR